MSQAIGFDDVVLGRRSIRGFLDKPVPKELIAEIIEVAMRAPSSYNNQCWNFSVVTGAPLVAIRRGNTEGILAGKPDSREFRTFNVVPDEHRGRQFDAPVSIVVTYDRVLLGSDIAPFDCGAVTNALVNAAWSRGLGCVINSQGIMQSPVVREHAKIPDDQVIMICVALGWPDEDFPANAVVSNRKRVAEAARFVGFDD